MRGFFFWSNAGNSMSRNDRPHGLICFNIALNIVSTNKTVTSTSRSIKLHFAAIVWRPRRLNRHCTGRKEYRRRYQLSIEPIFLSMSLQSVCCRVHSQPLKQFHRMTLTKVADWGGGVHNTYFDFWNQRVGSTFLYQLLWHICSSCIQRQSLMMLLMMMMMDQSED